MRPATMAKENGMTGTAKGGNFAKLTKNPKTQKMIFTHCDGPFVTP